MAYGVEDFCRDCKSAIDGYRGKADLDAVRGYLEKLLKNEAFLNEHCGPDAEVGTHTLYRDPDTDFMLLAHIQDAGRTSPPHDHDASWAVYGQAVGWTDMTEYDRKDDGSQKGKAELEVSRKYRLEPGMAGYFPPHAVHSIHFPDKARFIRVTGTDLTQLATLRYNMAEKSVNEVNPNRAGEAAGAASA